MTRVACVWVDWFAAAAVARAEPALAEPPLAVVAGGPAIRRVCEANAAARDAGVRPGMTETAARTWCPALAVRPWAEATERAARHALCEAALGVSPRVEDWAAGIVHVDADGLEGLHGDADAIGRHLARNARAVGLPARVALAGSRAAARVVVAGAAATVSVVPPGEDRGALAAAPLGALALAEPSEPGALPGVAADLVETLERWGLHTLGELAALPRDGLAARLGPAGLRAHDLALGLDRAPFRPWAPPPFWEEAQGLDWEIDALEPLVAALGRVLERLVARLDAARLATDTLEIRLDLAPGGADARTIPLACPMREVRPMLALVRLDLEARPPGAAVTRVAMSARAVRLVPTPGGLFTPPAPASRDLAAALARLATLVGPANLGSPRLENSHRPDAFALVEFAVGVGSRDAAGAHAPSNTGQLALRRLRPPRGVAVEVDGDERPSHVDGRRVVAWAGPWRASGEWWDVGVWARDEWDVAIAGGALCRLAHDRRLGAWLLDGVYD